MGHATRCKLGFGCFVALTAAAAVLVLPSAAPLAAPGPPHPPGPPAHVPGAAPNVHLPNNGVPGVANLGAAAENAAGVDLPNVGPRAPEAEPLPEPAAKPEPAAPAPQPAPAPNPAGGQTPAGGGGGTAAAAEPTASTGGGSGGGGSGGGSGGGGGSPAAASQGGASAVPATAGDADGTARDSDPEPREAAVSRARFDEQPRSALGGFLNDVEELPWSLFAAVIALAALSLMMTGRSALLARLSRRLQGQGDELREDVGALQSALLPEIPERIGDVEISVAYRPKDGPAAGGDFHDVIALRDDRIAVVVGDVSGHGREALTITALAHYTVRAYLEAGLEPREALVLAEEALGGKLGEDFVTVLAAVYDPAASTITYAMAGHPAPIVANAEGHRPVHVLTPPPIGVGPRTGFRQTTISIPSGAEVFAFTDGLVEARQDGAAMVDREGLEEVLAGLGDGLDAAEVLDRIDAEAEVADDMTACVLRPLSASGDAVVTEELDLTGAPAICDRLDPFLDAFGMAPADRESAIAECRRAADSGQPSRLRLRRDDTGQVQWAIGIAGGAHPLAPAQAPVGVAG
jgi:hypothetical protein